MTSLDIVSLTLSAFVAIVAALTAYVSYKNFQAVTSVTLYLYPETKEGTFEQNNYQRYPVRIMNSLLKNGITIPPQYPMPIRWFDLSIGNTGPGIARILSWRINYIQTAQDKNVMSSNEPFYLGPQAKIAIVDYIPRDYSNDKFGHFFNRLTKLDTEDGKFPWRVTVIYERQRGFNKNAKYGLEFEVNQEGGVKAVEICVS